MALGNLKQFGDIGNSMGSIVPAIALMYARNHYRYPDEIERLKIDDCCPPTIQDISDGVQFVFKQGGFHHKVGDRTSICPAKNALVGYSNTRLKTLEPEVPMELVPYESKSDKTIWPDSVVYPLDEDVFNKSPGAMIYSIYKAIAFNPDVKQRLQALINPAREDSQNPSEAAYSTVAKGCPFSKKA